jgi:hypothetical protein
VNRPSRSNFANSLRVRLVATALGIGGALAMAPTASAQFGGRSGMASMFTPDFLPRDLPVFVDALALEEWQRPILELLIDEYGTNFNTAADGVRSRMGNMRDAAGASPERVVEMISAPLVSWMDEKKKLRDDFLASVRSQLSDSQVEQWPRLERALRREKSLPLGELSGESLDLTLVLREIDAPPVALDAAAPAIEQYEIRLDETLAARDTALDAAVAPLLKAMSSSDVDRGIATQESIMQKRTAVRTAQEEGVATIRDALGGEYGAEFERRAMQKAFPQVYRPDPITPLFEGALALPEIAEEVRTSLTSLQSQFNAEHDVVRTALVESYRVSEPREPRRRTEIARQRAAGATVRMGDAPEVEQAKATREELYEKYRKLLAETLTEEQLQAVPGLSKLTEPDPAQIRAAQQAAELSGSGKPRKPGLPSPVADDAPASIEKSEPGKPAGGAGGDGLQSNPDGAGGSPKKKGG